jgi:CheY-like chemotaxis protein
MNIVMLDDERISLAVLKNHVGMLDGTRGFAFTHPSDALRWCAANKADAVIIDFMMHEMDGLEFVERFRLLPGNADVPMLMVTGSRDAELQRRAHEAGVTGFLTKPLDVVALRKRLSEVLALRAGEKKLAELAP